MDAEGTECGGVAATAVFLHSSNGSNKSSGSDNDNLILHGTNFGDILHEIVYTDNMTSVDVDVDLKISG